MFALHRVACILSGIGCHEHEYPFPYRFAYVQSSLLVWLHTLLAYKRFLQKLLDGIGADRRYAHLVGRCVFLVDRIPCGGRRLRRVYYIATMQKLPQRQLHIAW